MDKTISHVKAVGRVAHAVAAPAAQAVLPAAPGYGGYWNYVTAVKGTLHTWLGFFSWSSPQPLSTASTSGGSSNPVSTVTGALNAALNASQTAGLAVNQAATAAGQQLVAGPTANAQIPATTPGLANAIPGLGNIGSWLKSITGIGQ